MQHSAVKTFIRVIEVWVPDAEGRLLEFGAGLYGRAKGFGALSRSMVFGRGEGLPGRAWEGGRPIMLKQLEGSYFRRGWAAAAEGLHCAVALPFFRDKQMAAVMLIFCGDDEAHVGALELWHNTPARSQDLSLLEGYYGGTAEVFEFMSRHMSFRKGSGLPGLAWESGLPQFMPDLGKGTRFLRADSATRVGINRGFAIPCASLGAQSHVLVCLSALATPIVRRFETWVAHGDGAAPGLLRQGGFCEKGGPVAAGASSERVERGQGLLGRVLASGVPGIAERAVDEPGAVGAAAREAGLQSLVALPVNRQGQVAAVVGWYF